MVVDAIILIGGVIIVVYTINENLGLFKKQKLPFMALRWLKEFALIGKPRTVEMRDIVSGQGFVGRATLSAKRRWKTPEEHLMELERRIDECRQLVFDKEKEINLRIDRCKQELKNEIHGSNEKIREFEKLLDKTVVGGLKIQLFGVLLLIYGALIPIL